MSLKSLIDLDIAWSDRLRLNPSKHWLFRVAAFLAHSGDSWFWLAALGLIWLLMRGEWHMRSAILAIGILGLAVVVLAIKFTVRRQRPVGDWGAVYRITDPNSFPSGHAARCAMLAVIAIGLGPAWLGWVLVFWAPLVALARVITGLHFLSDILVGMLLGLIAGAFMLAITPLLLQLFPFLF